VRTEEYTLLIVESPTIADYINHMHIPWLEVMATGGFCWYPKFDAKKLKLGKQADPKRKKLRKELKHRSEWFKKIVIATDSDPSGDFIAWTIGQFLPNKKLYRSYIKLLTDDSIKNQILNAVEFSQNDLKPGLEKRFVFHHLWNRHFSIRLSEAALASLFLNIQPHTTFSDSSGQIYRANKAIHIQFATSVNPVKKNAGYHLDSAVSTYHLLEELSSLPSFKKFNDALDKIFDLFTARLNDELLHTISYPRTTAIGYYKSTWRWIENEWIKNYNLDKLLPAHARMFVNDGEPHESLHPTIFYQTPEILRGILKPDLYEIYQLVFKLFMKSITWKQSDYLVYQKKTKVHLYPKNNLKIKNSPIVRPVWTIESLGRRLYELGAVRPANYGSKLDKWLDKNLLVRDGFVLGPGKIIERDPELISKCHTILIRANRMINMQNSETEQLKKLFG